MAHPGDITFSSQDNAAPDTNLDLSLTSDLFKSPPGNADSDHPSAPPEMNDEPEGESSLPGSVEASPLPQTKVPPRLPPLGSNIVHPETQGDSNGLERNTVGWKNPIATDLENGGENEARINDLLNMLECPICLDTADHPPIFQCPEGHLLCEDCNSRLVDCPQCGHALMNSRNRTAEELAAKLQTLRGDRRDGYLPSQSISISVSAPEKIRKGLFAHVVYNIKTKVGQEGSQADSNPSSFSVQRKYTEITDLYARLVNDYLHEGIIVPPPPEKNRLATVAVKISPNTDLNESLASHMFEKRCLALDRYMKRLARHPVLRKDPSFRSFIQEKDVPKKLKVSKSFMSSVKERMSIFKSRFTVTEHDPWFQTRNSQLDTLTKQLREMQENLKDMSELKTKLFAKTNDFQRGLVSMLVSKENNMGNIINQVVDCHKTMGLIHQEQAKADDLIVQLAWDYERLVSSAKDVLAQRRKFQQEMQKVQKGKNPLEEIEKIQVQFDKVSQTIRRELEHFDFVMKDEFEEGFSAYNSTYWHTLKKSSKNSEYNLED